MGHQWGIIGAMRVLHVRLKKEVAKLVIQEMAKIPQDWNPSMRTPTAASVVNRIIWNALNPQPPKETK